MMIRERDRARTGTAKFKSIIVGPAILYWKAVKGGTVILKYVWDAYLEVWKVLSI